MPDDPSPDPAAQTLRRTTFLRQIEAATMRRIDIREIRSLFLRLPDNIRQLLVTLALSAAAASAAIIFLSLINLAYDATFSRFVTMGPRRFAIASFVLITISSLAVGLLLRRWPDASGSGIPQLKAAYWKELGYVPLRPVLLKLAAGILSIAGGASLGREGPSVYLGGGTASVLSGFLGRPKRQRRQAAVVGAAAGLAAAFNTPLAAITFVLEEIITDLNSRSLGVVVLAALGGALLVHATLGQQPAFNMPAILHTGYLHLLVVPVVAVVAALCGIFFQRWTLRLRGLVMRQKSVPRWLVPVLGGWVTWSLAMAVFLTTGKIGIFSLGYHDLSAALNNQVLWYVAGIMVIPKLLATMVSYGTGSCGGIFAPSLFIGGMSGYFLAGLAGLWLPMTPSDHLVCAAVGMSACLGALVRAPLTSMLIVFEMTHQFSMVPGLMLGTIISQTLSRFMLKTNLYDALLLQDGHELIRIKPPRDLESWQNLTVMHIMNHSPVVIESWDEGVAAAILSKHPYRWFPFVNGGRLEGMVSREMVSRAIESHEPPVALPAVYCLQEATIRQVADKFIESPCGVMAVVDPQTRMVRGVLTLHDLLRAQAACLD